MIKLRSLKHLGGHRLHLEFSDDSAGVRDFSFVKDETGPMLEPLKDPKYFARAFVESGVLTWPKGYDWDSKALHAEMRAEGLLRPADAAE